MSAAKTEEELYDHYSENWSEYIEDVIGAELEDFQVTDIVEAIQKYDNVAIKACHSVGKTFTIARVILAFQSLYYCARVITTAPTFRQVQNVLWAEIRSAYKNARVDLGGKMLQTAWYMDDDEYYSLGFSPKVGAGGEKGQGTDSSFQGIHAPYILIVIDEAVGVHSKIFKQAEGLRTSGYVVKFLIIGNPTSRNCEFFRKFGLPEWHCVTIDCFKSPNLWLNGIDSVETLEKIIRRLKRMAKPEVLEYLQSIPVINPHLIRADWVIARALEWGLDHPLMLSKALAEFPEDDDSVLIQFRTVQKAIEREPVITKNVLRCGIDPGHLGSDPSVISFMLDDVLVGVHKYRKLDGPGLCQAYFDLCGSVYKRQASEIGVDGTGVGASCCDHFKLLQRKGDMPREIKIHRIHFGASADDKAEDQKPESKDAGNQEYQEKKRYKNLKAKGYDLLNEDLKASIAILKEGEGEGDFEGLGVEAEELEKLQFELPALKHHYGSDGEGKMQMQSKEEYRSDHGGTSPNHADSIMICNLTKHLKTYRPGVWAQIGKIKSGGFSEGGLHDY